jgi:pimeloyl-ACP methyl ester carboxylesterase
MKEKEGSMSTRKTTPIVSGRTRFGDDIVAEFWMPRRPSGRAIILCDGCPSLPSRARVALFFARKGYWVFHPRYRGTWESSGEFLRESPEEDVRIVAHALNQGFTDIVSGETYVLDISSVTVIGASFGGTAAILSLRDPIITHAIALAPVIDWTRPGKDEPFPYFLRLLREGFGGAYRAIPGGWKKLQRGKFYSPQHEAISVDPARLFIVHAKDDRVVPSAPLREFARKHRIRPLFLEEGGHLSVRAVTERNIWKEVAIFLAGNR